MKKASTLMILAASLTGCTVNDVDLCFQIDIPEEHYVKGPEHEKKIEDYQKWWSEAMVGAPEELLALAKENNPDLGTVTEHMQQLLDFYGINKENIRALEDRRENKGPLKMQRSVYGSICVSPMLRQFRHMQSFQETFHKSFHRVSYFDARFEIDLFKRGLYYQNSAIEDILAAKELKKDYFAYLKAQILKEVLLYRSICETIETVKKHRAYQNQLFIKLSLRRENDLETQETLDKAKAVMHILSDKLRHYKHRRIRQVNAISKLTGINDAKMLRSLLNDKQKNSKLDHEVVTKTPIAVIAKRPDLRAARRAVNKSAYAVGVAAAEKYPKFYLCSNLEALAESMHKLFDPKSFAYMFGIDMVTNFFEHWKIDAEEKIRRSDFRSAVYNYKKSITEALVDVSEKVLDLLESREKLARADEKLDQAIKELAGLKARSNVLSVPILQQMQADLKGLEAKEEHLFACQQNSQNVIALVRSLGL